MIAVVIREKSRMPDDLKDFLSSFSPNNPDPNRETNFEFKYSNGFVLTGKCNAETFRRLFRDPSNIQAIISDGIPAGTAVVTVLPP